MIKAKHDDQYKQVGFIKVRQPDGTYKDVEKKYGKTTSGEYGLVFEKGFTREVEGALPLVINGIGKPLKDYTIYGNVYQSENVSPDTLQEVVGVGERTGNLFDTGNTEDIIKSTYINQNGELVTNAAYCMSYPIKVIGGASYTWSFDTFTNAKHTAPTVAFYDSDDSLISVATHSGSIKWFSFSAPENCKYVRGSVYTGQGNITSMLLNGERSGNANYPLPYEPYGYKADVVTRGKNLFDGWNVSKTFLGLTCKTSENMAIVLNGTKIDGLNVQSITRPNILLKAGTYTISIKMISGSIEGITDGVFFGINQNTYGQRTAPGVLKIGDIGKRTFTLTEDTTLSSFDIAPSYGSPGAIFTNATFECQFEYGDTATEYSPYVEPITTPIYLDSPLYKIGDYADSRGMAEEVRVIKELILTGDENWMIWNGNYYSSVIDSKGKSSKLYSTHFINSIASGVSYEPSATSALKIAASAVPFISDVSELKAWLAAQYAAGTPVKVYYVLAEPETKAVEPVEIPTINGSTVIDVDAEVKPSNVYIKYKSKNIIQNGGNDYEF